MSDAGAQYAGTCTAPTCAHINRRYSTVYFLHPLSQTKTPTRTHSFPTCLCCCFVRLRPSCCESLAQLEEEYTHTLPHAHTHRWQIPIKLRAVPQYVRRLSDIWCYAPGGGGGFSTSIPPHQRRGMSLDSLPPLRHLSDQQVASPELTCYLAASCAPKRSRGHPGVLPSADWRYASLAKR